MDILCPTDLTPAADAALAHAAHIAARSGASITLLHVLDKHERKDGGADAGTQLDRAARGIDPAVKVTEVLRDGDVLKQIIAEADKGHGLMVAGTHGAHGLRRSLLGTDILKLVRHVAIPTLVVQEAAAPADIARVVMPVSGHADIRSLLDAVSLLAGLYAAEVHIHQVMRPGEQPSERLLANKALTEQRLATDGIRYVDATEPSEVFSAGFAEQTIRYAERIGAGCIAIMAKASDEYRWIADAEKERLLMNGPRIPVLCAV